MSSTRAFDSIPGGVRRSWIATQPFNDYFYSYNKGAFGENPGTFEQCPVGRILRENGRKLYPDANPGVDKFYVGVYDPVTFLNGFIDPNNAIYAPFNDNKPTYVGDSMDDVHIGYVNCNADQISPVPDAGPPVFTNGNIIALGNGGANFIGVINELTGASAAFLGYETAPFNPPGPYSFLPYVGAILAGPETDGARQAYMGVDPNQAYLTLISCNAENPSVYLSSGDGSNDNTPYLGVSYNLDTTGQQGYLGATDSNSYLTLQDPGCNTTVSISSGDNNGHLAYISTSGTVSYGTGLRVPDPALVGKVHLSDIAASNGPKRMNVSAAGCTSNSKVFLTYAGVNNPGFLTVDSTSNGSFTVASTTSNDNSYVQYFIVN